MPPRSIVLITLALVVALVVADIKGQYLPISGAGALNRGGTLAQSGNLAASALGKQFAEGANKAAQSAEIAQGNRPLTPCEPLTCYPLCIRSESCRQCRGCE